MTTKLNLDHHETQLLSAIVGLMHVDGDRTLRDPFVVGYTMDCMTDGERRVALDSLNQKLADARRQAIVPRGR